MSGVRVVAIVQAHPEPLDMGIFATEQEAVTLIEAEIKHAQANGFPPVRYNVYIDGIIIRAFLALALAPDDVDCFRTSLTPAHGNGIAQWSRVQLC